MILASSNYHLLGTTMHKRGKTLNLYIHFTTTQEINFEMPLFAIRKDGISLANKERFIVILDNGSARIASQHEDSDNWFLNDLGSIPSNSHIYITGVIFL